MRKTKIVCTMGPATADDATVEQLCLAGMNVARLNFSHGDHTTHAEMIARIKRVREKLGLPIAILLDTKGPEYRIGRFTNGPVTLAAGDTFRFYADSRPGSAEGVSVSYPAFAAEMRPGDRILLNNGLMIFRVTGVEPEAVVTTVESDGVVSDRKSMSFPGKVFSHPYLSEQDKADLRFGLAQGIDFIACSFVSCRRDLDDIHDFLKAESLPEPELIAKIENRAGIENIEEICAACSGIMIGRGDMGVEIPFEELPAIQKQLITRCRLLGKRVITATEMLESMIHNVRPTRAEISDVANAVFDGTSAVMLSAETAAGEHPVLTVETMARIVAQTEKAIDYRERFYSSDFVIRNSVDAISHATCDMAIKLEAKGIAVSSLSGMTVRMVSRFRPPVDILGVTTDEGTWRRLALSWGVTPMLTEVVTSTDVMFYNAKRQIREAFSLGHGDRIVMTGGMTNGHSGNTDTIKLETV